MVKLEETRVDNLTHFSLLIDLPREEKDEALFFNHLDNILSHQIFGLILEVRGEKSFSPEAKKKLGIWFKSNKPQLKEKCVGFARVKAGAGSTDRLKSRALSLAMPCPYLVCSSTGDALEWLKKKS